jgi:competence protein ComEC
LSPPSGKATGIILLSRQHVSFNASPASVSGYLATCLALGILAACFFRTFIEWCPPAILLILLLVWLAKERSPSIAFWVLAGLGIGVLGYWRMSLAFPQNRPAHFLHHGDPEQVNFQIRILEELRHNSFSRKYMAEVIGINSQPAEGKLLLELEHGETEGFLPGQELLTPLVPARVNPPSNPGQFNYRAYLHNQGVYGRLKIGPGEFLRVAQKKAGLLGLLRELRSYLLNSLEKTGLPEPKLGIAKALLLGDRTEVDPAVYGNYRKAGALHLLAVSGLHVGILATLVLTLLAPLKKLPYGKEIHLILGILLLWGYAFLAGFSPSVVRAVILFTAVAYALLRQRPGQTIHFLALAWIFMLVLINPGWLLQVGFQLSFAAVTGIVVFFPVLYRKWPWKSKPWSYPGKLLAVSLSAQAGTLPLVLYYFHQFPGLFLLSNLLLLPGIGLVLALGLLCLLLQVLSLLPPFLILVYENVLSLMNRTVDWIARQEAFHMEYISWDFGQTAATAIAILLLAGFLKSGRKSMLGGAALSLIGAHVFGLVLWMNAGTARNWLVPHKVGHSIVWVRQGRELNVFAADSLSSRHLLRDARVLWRLETVTFNPLENQYDLGGQTLRILDSTGLYSPCEPSPDVLLLSGSPKVHLDRLLEELQPGQVIADGSNYHSLLSRWEKSCSASGIRFHATSLQGAFLKEIPRR